MTLTQSYEPTRDLLTGMDYHRVSMVVAQRTYTYNILGHPTARNTASNGQTVNNSFAYNSRSQLAEATVSGKEYEYTYDYIGNCTTAVEDCSGVANRTAYTANELNQYTAIAENGAISFVPLFDSNGNQTLIKTYTGISSAVYNAKNRPINFSNEATFSATARSFSHVEQQPNLINGKSILYSAERACHTVKNPAQQG